MSESSLRHSLGAAVTGLLFALACGSEAGSSKPGSKDAGTPDGTLNATGGVANGTGGTSNGSSGGGTTGSGGLVDTGGAGGRPARGGAAGSGNSAGQTGTGGTTACPPECFVSTSCVKACGDTPQDFGCCPCPAGMMDAHSCVSTDAGNDGTGSCDARKVRCNLAPPPCSFGSVPSITGACYGPCVKVDTCTCKVAADCPDSNQYTCLVSKGTCTPYL